MTTPGSRPVLIVLPKRDFDPSEVAVTWQVLKNAGNSVIFATADGLPAVADPLMLSGEELDLWGRIPVLRKAKVLGLALRANSDARRAYASMQDSPSFRAPVAYSTLRIDQYDGLVLPGGHWARGMREYLEDTALQRFVGDFFEADKPVAAICHGVVLAARSLSARTGKSVLYGRKTTALTWRLEKAAWITTKYFGRVPSRRVIAVCRPKLAARWHHPLISAMFRRKPATTSEKPAACFATVIKINGPPG
jgi:putative intracellular protease/amidase